MTNIFDKTEHADSPVAENSFERSEADDIRNTENLRHRLLRELGQFSLICGVAVGGALLVGCDDDAWYDEVRLEDCNHDNRIDTRDKDCQGASDDDAESSSGGGGSWDNHYNVIEYPNWADVSNW